MSAADVPKAELHVHLEGTADLELLDRLAERHGVAPVPRDLLTGWTGFLDFLARYDVAASLMRTGEDLRDVTYAYLSRCAAEGALYVELIASLGHGDVVGLADDEHLDGIARGIDDAHRDHGIVGRILSSVVRNFGVPKAEDVARRTVALDHPYVVGFNMAGDEAGFPAVDFARAFAIAHDGGLGCSVHAGEWAGPESVRAALALPGVTRISHGVRAIEDPALVEELARRGTVLEVCPTSNVALGVFGSWAEHPLPALRAAGVRLTLGSDDPPYFGTSIGLEYARASSELGLDGAALLELTRTALDAAFADDRTLAALRDRLRRP